MLSLPEDDSEEVQISVHSDRRSSRVPQQQQQQQQDHNQHQQPRHQRQQSRYRQYLSVPFLRPLRNRRNNSNSRHLRERSPPTPASQNRFHPDQVEEEEYWLSPAPSPVSSATPSPITSPMVQRCVKKWQAKSLPQMNGCNTCRGEIAISSHQRPRLKLSTFIQVPSVLHVLYWYCIFLKLYIRDRLLIKNRHALSLSQYYVVWFQT